MNQTMISHRNHFQNTHWQRSMWMRGCNREASHLMITSLLAGGVYRDDQEIASIGHSDIAISVTFKSDAFTERSTLLFPSSSRRNIAGAVCSHRPYPAHLSSSTSGMAIEFCWRKGSPDFTRSTPRCRRNRQQFLQL